MFRVSIEFWLMFGVKRTITSYCFTLLSKMQMTPLLLVLLLSYALWRQLCRFTWIIKPSFGINQQSRMLFSEWLRYPGGGGGVLNKVLYGEAPPRGPTPYPFIYHFGRKDTPFITFYWKKVPLSHTYLRKSCSSFCNCNCNCNCTNWTLPLGLFRTNFTMFPQAIGWDRTSAYKRRLRLPLSVHYWSHPPDPYM